MRAGFQSSFFRKKSETAASFEMGRAWCSLMLVAQAKHHSRNPAASPQRCSNWYELRATDILIALSLGSVTFLSSSDHYQELGRELLPGSFLI
jgi:hypothetical protein